MDTEPDRAWELLAGLADPDSDLRDRLENGDAPAVLRDFDISVEGEEFEALPTPEAFEAFFAQIAPGFQWPPWPGPWPDCPGCHWYAVAALVARRTHDGSAS
jgi:hypothetical protein